MAILIVITIFILISAGLAAYFLKNDRGEKEPIGALWLAFGFGFLGAIAASVIEGLLPIKDLTTSAPLGALFVSAMLVGVVEEACKFIPLSLYLYPKRYFNEYTDGLIYFGLAGLGFGLPENILYTIAFGAGTGAGRILLTPFFHAATTSLAGYFLIKMKINKRPRREAWLVLAAMMFTHGLYDFGLASKIPLLSLLSVCITLTMTIILFVLYSKATYKDQQLGLSAVGHNSFCRNCGTPNPDNLLYCTHCGKHA